MPYEWTTARHGAAHDSTLSLWPHRSLSRRGFAGFMLITFFLIILPLFSVLGSPVLWALLPFLMAAVGAIWWALEHSYHTARLTEVLTIAPDEVHLLRTNPRGDTQEWGCNRYWARVEMHRTGGPVEHYITLKGAGREVEIGAFLSEDERKALYGELSEALVTR
ncbi:DUF2244 domain-containing protein [Roseovarius tibetensis]|uniref:DUF2244 domain-containing protein n=1 Tax=Roseovarius tibetensis TaxID=2685897 RepID=UPI003D7FF8F2